MIAVNQFWAQHVWCMSWHVSLIRKGTTLSLYKEKYLTPDASVVHKMSINVCCSVDSIPLSNHSVYSQYSAGAVDFKTKLWALAEYSTKIAFVCSCKKDSWLLNLMYLHRWTKEKSKNTKPRRRHTWVRNELCKFINTEQVKCSLGCLSAIWATLFYAGHIETCSFPLREGNLLAFVRLQVRVCRKRKYLECVKVFLGIRRHV